MGHGRDVSLEWAEERVFRQRDMAWCGALRCRFTAEVLSGWQSPPPPRLSAQTQTAPVERERARERELDRIECKDTGQPVNPI